MPPSVTMVECTNAAGLGRAESIHARQRVATRRIGSAGLQVSLENLLQPRLGQLHRAIGIGGSAETLHFWPFTDPAAMVEK